MPVCAHWSDYSCILSANQQILKKKNFYPLFLLFLHFVFMVFFSWKELRFAKKIIKKLSFRTNQEESGTTRLHTNFKSHNLYPPDCPLLFTHRRGFRGAAGLVWSSMYRHSCLWNISFFRSLTFSRCGETGVTESKVDNLVQCVVYGMMPPMTHCHWHRQSAAWQYSSGLLTCPSKCQREGRKRDFETSPRVLPTRIGHNILRGRHTILCRIKNKR